MDLMSVFETALRYRQLLDTLISLDWLPLIKPTSGEEKRDTLVHSKEVQSAKYRNGQPEATTRYYRCISLRVRQEKMEEKGSGG